MIEFREPPRTGFELTWRMIGIRVRVFPSFFLVAAIFGYLIVGPDPIGIAVDVVCIFAAILFTEVVQGVVYRSYGLRSTLLIQEFGGGVYPEAEPPSALQRIIVALASPASSFLLFVLVYYSNEKWGWSETSKYANFAYMMLWIISLFWGIIGLLPIYPYPGGRVMAEVIGVVMPRHGLKLTLVISIGVGLAYIAYTVAVIWGDYQRIPLPGGVSLPANLFAAIFFAIATIRNWQILQSIRSQPRVYHEDDYDDQKPWER